MTWDERADLWFKDHPALKLVIDGLAILALGWLFFVAFRGLIVWKPM